MFNQASNAASDLFGGHTHGASNTGVAAQNAYPTFAQMAQAQLRKSFELEEVENGVILYYRNKKYICANMDEAFDRAKACMVEERINK